MASSRSSAWLFEDHYPGTVAHDIQLVNTALLRLQVLILFRPIRQLLKASQ